jgi:hypothetical protein
MGKEKSAKKEDSAPITRDYTIDLHKRLHGMYVRNRSFVWFADRSFYSVS